jgi:hypothetical protein
VTEKVERARSSSTLAIELPASAAHGVELGVELMDTNTVASENKQRSTNLAGR